MPKINVYLSDDLARAVREAAIPVSAVCQHALAQALQRATALRERPDAAAADAPEVPSFLRVGLPPTPRLADALVRAEALAGEGGTVFTEHLALGLVDEGGNLAVRALEVMGIDLAAVRARLAEVVHTGAGRRLVNRLDAPATHVLRASEHEAAGTARSSVGCEHVLLALVDERFGAGGRVLRRAGVNPVVARRTVVAAVAGLLDTAGVPPAAGGPAESAKLDEIIDRLGRLEALLARR
jgi:ATP-dependent Clp protease ATP-binding subunit ClpC